MKIKHSDKLTVRNQYIVTVIGYQGYLAKCDALGERTARALYNEFKDQYPGRLIQVLNYTKGWIEDFESKSSNAQLSARDFVYVK